MRWNMHDIDKKTILKKFVGKGGWTYAETPEIPPDPNAPFGWVSVNGSIDNYPLARHKLMPMGDGSLFLPVNAAIRKALKKAAGDQVHLTLNVHHAPSQLTEELLECFALEPQDLLPSFYALPPDKQSAYIDWIYEAKTEKGKVGRIAEMMSDISSR